MVNTFTHILWDYFTGPASKATLGNMGICIMYMYQLTIITYIAKTSQGTRKPNAYFMGSIVCHHIGLHKNTRVNKDVQGSSRSDYLYPPPPPPDKIAPILEDDIFKCIFFNEDDKIPIQIETETCSRESNWQ